MRPCKSREPGRSYVVGGARHLRHNTSEPLAHGVSRELLASATTIAPYLKELLQNDSFRTELFPARQGNRQFLLAWLCLLGIFPSILFEYVQPVRDQELLDTTVLDSRILFLVGQESEQRWDVLVHTRLLGVLVLRPKSETQRASSSFDTELLPSLAVFGLLFDQLHLALTWNLKTVVMALSPVLLFA